MRGRLLAKAKRLLPARRWQISWRGYIPILLLASFGMLTTWALFQEVSRLERERVNTAFNAAAHDRILAVQRELQSSLNVVQDIGSFFDASQHVRRGQFREFVQPVLKRDPSIRSLEWVSRVAAEQRDEFVRNARLGFSRFDIFGFGDSSDEADSRDELFPLLFAHPYRRDETPLGLDFATLPTEFPTIQRAREQRSMQISYSRHTVAELNVYLPVFERADDELAWFDDNEVGPEPIEAHFGQLRGVAIGRFFIEEMVNRALSNLSPSGIDIDIRVAHADDPRLSETLYAHQSRLRADDPMKPDTLVGDRLSLIDSIDIAGRQWTLVCSAVPGIFQPSAWSARFVFAGGMAFTLLLVAYLISLVGRAEEVARLVSQRTVELEYSNQALNRQVSERLKAEKALQALNVTLEQRVAQRAAEAERRAGELEQFAYVTSHDLKAPLRAVANLAEWLEEDLSDSLTEDTREQLKLMRDRVGRMHGLIEGLLTYSRVGRTEGELQQVDSAELLAEVIDSLAPPAGFSIEVAPDLPNLYTDRLQLGQVFANLISNSVKHHHKTQGRVRIYGHDLGGHCEFVVLDDGPGIPARYHAKVFMMFQTLQVKDFGSDTGIGLALVKKIVEEHGGTIGLTSEAGSGTEIRFTWQRDIPKN